MPVKKDMVGAEPNQRDVAMFMVAMFTVAETMCFSCFSQGENAQ